MKTKSNKTIAFASVIIFLAMFFCALSTHAAGCQCRNYSMPYVYPKVGELFNVTDSKICESTCKEQGTKYFQFNDGPTTAISTSTSQMPANASPTGTVPNATATKYSSAYEPMEEIPGFGKPKDFPSYLMAVYKFGLWAIGISALLMITIGGYMYIGSAGNKSTVETAKKIIFDALAGVILAMVSWLLLYLINPDLIKFM